MKTELKTITPEIAKQMLVEYVMEGQRPINANRVSYYAQMMSAGEWRPGTQIVLAQNGDGTFLINGQHRLQAIIQSNAPQEFSLLTRDETLEQARKSYQVEDMGGGRTSLDAIRVSKLPDRTGLTETELRRMLSGCLIIYNQFNTSNRRPNVSPAERELLVIEWYSVYKHFMACYLGEDNVKVGGQGTLYGISQRAIVIACGLYTLRHQPTTADIFWRSVFVPKDISSGQPEFRLREYLIANTGSGSGHAVKKHLTIISKIWNAAYEGRKLGKLFPDTPLPHILFSGCPDPRA